MPPLIDNLAPLREATLRQVRRWKTGRHYPLKLDGREEHPSPAIIDSQSVKPGSPAPRTAAGS